MFKPLFIKVLILILLISSATGSFSQHRINNFIVYSKETGLGLNTYHEVFESSDGYWWIGSNNGVFRFDGKRFEQFIPSYNDSNSLSDNNIIDFVEDKNSNLWLAGYFSGLTRYNLKTGKFKQYKKLSQDSIPRYPIRCIFKDKEGQLWFGTGGRGIAKYLPEKDTFQFYFPNPAKKTDGSIYGDNYVTGILEDNTDPNFFWVSCFDGLYRFNKVNNSFAHFKNFDTFNPDFANFFLCIEQLGNQLFLGTWFNALIVFNKDSGKFTRVPYNNLGGSPYKYGILDMQYNGDSLIYLAAMNDGLLAYNAKTKKVNPILTQADVEHLNTTINIQKVSLTKNAGFFAGGNSAIYQMHPGHNKFTVYKTLEDLKQIFKAGSLVELTSSCYDKIRKGYWMVFFNHNGVVFYDEDLSKRQHFSISHEDKWMEDIAVDGNGRVLAVSQEGNLFVLNENLRRFEPEKNIFKNQTIGNLIEIESDKLGNIWLAGRTSVYHYNIKNEKLTSFPIPLNKILPNSKNGIVQITLRVNSKNEAWMASNAGLLHFDVRSGNTHYYYSDLNNSQKLASGVIKSMAIDNDDNIWLGFHKEGIQVIDTKQMRIIKSFTIEDGLTSMEVNYMACDEKNNVFACLHSGLMGYNWQLNEWQTFTALDGLKRVYLDRPIFANPGNRIILSQHTSFTLFNTDSLWLKKDNPVTHITSLLVNGKPENVNTLPDYINAVKLSSKTRDIYIAFSATNWQFPFRTKYFYRVDGIHNAGEWIKTEGATANLTGLASGTYNFRFYAITNDGIKTAERQLKIEISPPFYKTWWFVLLCLAGISFILYSIYKYRINQLKKLLEMRSNISRNLHDDIGASLSNINILNELAKRNTDNPEKSKEYLNKSAEDIQRVSESLNDIVWNINPRYDDLQNLFERMKRYAADMMDGKNINYTIEFPEDVAKISLSMEKRRDLYLIFKEAVNNMVKYSNSTQAALKLEVEKKKIILFIKDDGVGFDSSQIQYGNGIMNMQQRAAASGAVLKIFSQPGKGTEVRLEMDSTW